MHDKIFEILFAKDDITWQSLLLELVKAEGMDPWDIDVSLLAQRYIEMLQQLKHLDFHISGKVVLAAALLLKVKSTRLLHEDISNIDRLFASTEESELEGEFSEQEYIQGIDGEGNPIPTLIPHTPQPRKRKVSIY